MKLKEWMVKELIPWIATGTGIYFIFMHPYTWTITVPLGAVWVTILLVLAFASNVDLGT